MIANAFYENVERHWVEGRELGPDEPVENVVLEFSPVRPKICWWRACGRAGLPWASPP
jgi:hypothetical protein